MFGDWQQHGDNKEREDTVEQPTDASRRPQIILPENVREQLRQRRGFLSFKSIQKGANQ